jgi:MFS family permease
MVDAQPKNRRTLGLIFLTVFMDIVGFAVIIPMFPDLLRHYLESEGSQGTLVGSAVDAARWLAGTEPRPELVAVLFGGLLSAGFSFLQFICSPLWGSLSDRIGRRPVLVATLLVNLFATSCGFSRVSFGSSCSHVRFVV